MPGTQEKHRTRPAALAALAALGFLSLLALTTACFLNRYRDGARVGWAHGDPIVQIEPEGKLPSVDRARMVPLSRHTARPDEEDRVLGIAAEGTARAYPIGLLDRFEVVNDALPETPLVVVRCALTGVAAAWDRRIPDRTLLFETTGALWRDTLVLRDRETKSLWSAATGLAISGPLAGERLRGLPTVLTRGDRWDEVHPDSLYLDLGAATTAPVLMKLYRLSALQGISGGKTSDRRFKPKEEVFAVESGGEALAFTAREIERRDRVEADIAGEHLTIAWEEALAAPRAFSGSVERPILPMFWFALDRHFAAVRTLPGRTAARQAALGAARD